MRVGARIFFVFLVAAGCQREPRDFVDGGTSRLQDGSPEATAPGRPPPSTGAMVDWSQPPLGCVEELVPTIAPKPCPDLSGVADVFRDWPVDYPEDDRRYWRERKRGIDYCRAREVLRREEAAPGTFKPSQIELAWMRHSAVQRSDEKINSVYKASRYYSIPAHILVGALQQESLFSDIYVAEDGENFSCGIGQINLQEYCAWANRLTRVDRITAGWPMERVDCSSLRTSLIRPYFEMARSRANNLPPYRMTFDDHYRDISFAEVRSRWPAAEETTQRLWFATTQSFLRTCQDPLTGIDVKARALRNIFDRSVPEGFRVIDAYGKGDRFGGDCQQRGYDKAFPLHRGWLMAVGIYNAGPRAVDHFAYYHSLSRSQLASSGVVDRFTPADFVEAFYWSGPYNFKTDRIDFIDLEGRARSWTWFKPCVLQRHIARVVQHVTRPGIPALLDTLEGAWGCQRSVVNPETGELIKSGVPPVRQTSSGKKPATPGDESATGLSDPETEAARRSFERAQGSSVQSM